MKLTTNFALPIRRVLLAAFLISVIVSISFILAAYYLGRDRSSLLSENEKMTEILQAYSDASGTVSSGERRFMTVSETLSAHSRIERLNSYSPIKGMGVNQLLGTIEDLLPEGVMIRRLGYSAVDGQLDLSAETNDPDLIYIFMKRLEQSAFFESPLLQQQSAVGGNGVHGVQNIIQYEIHVVVRKI